MGLQYAIYVCYICRLCLPYAIYMYVPPHSAKQLIAETAGAKHSSVGSAPNIAPLPANTVATATFGAFHHQLLLLSTLACLGRLGKAYLKVEGAPSRVRL